MGVELIELILQYHLSNPTKPNDMSVELIELILQTETFAQ